jgi:hypothetical protein
MKIIQRRGRQKKPKKKVEKGWKNPEKHGSMPENRAMPTH